MRNLLLLVLLSFLVIPCFSLGGMDVSKTEEYLLSIDGLEIIKKTDDWYQLDYRHDMFYYQENSSSFYETMKEDPQVKKIIDSILYEISTFTRIDNLLYVFQVRRSYVFVYSIDTGELLFKKDMGINSTVPFYWKEREMFVYQISKKTEDTYSDYFHFYDQNTLELVEVLSLPQNNGISIFLNSVNAVSISDTQLILENMDYKSDILLYDLETNKITMLIELEKIYGHISHRLEYLRKIDDTTIEFCLIHDDAYFVCQYDLTKMVF